MNDLFWRDLLDIVVCIRRACKVLSSEWVSEDWEFVGSRIVQQYICVLIQKFKVARRSEGVYPFMQKSCKERWDIVRSTTDPYPVLRVQGTSLR